MKIVHGLLEGQVLQRNNESIGRAQICGDCTAAGDVEFRVLESGKVLTGCDWRVAGSANGTTFKITFDGIPTGGPYRIEMRIQSENGNSESLEIEEIFVGDVWILAGQSNMEGVGNMGDASEPQNVVRAFYMRDEWGMAEGKLHFLGEAVDKVHNSYGDGPERPPKEHLEKMSAGFIKGVGPGHAFGLEMQRRTGVPQGLIACAHGGTSMAQWSPDLLDKAGDSFYGAMMRRYEKLGQPVAGIVWYQGESDANEKDAAIYTENMEQLVAATRRDMKIPNLPWIIVQLGCHIASDGKYWNSIQEQQRLLPQVIDNLDVAPAVDLSLDDGIHISGKGQIVLGKRLARLADCLVHKSPGVKPGIALQKVELIPTPDTNEGCSAMSVLLSYDNVVGELVSQGRPNGFALINANGEEFPGIYKTTLDGFTVTLHTNLSEFHLDLLGVSYGHGRYPYCNITDSDGFSIPVIQNVLINPDHAPACLNWKTIRLPEVESTADVTFEMVENSTDWQTAPPREGFGVLPKSAEDKEVGVFAMRTSLTASEELDALLILGVNSPFKIWLNGDLVCEDSEATMPLNPDQYKINISLAEGKNRLLLTIAPIGPGAHLGICARVGTQDRKVERRITL